MSTQNTSEVLNSENGAMWLVEYPFDGELESTLTFDLDNLLRELDMLDVQYYTVTAF